MDARATLLREGSALSFHSFMDGFEFMLGITPTVNLVFIIFVILNFRNDGAVAFSLKYSYNTLPTYNCGERKIRSNPDIFKFLRLSAITGNLKI